MICFVWSDPLPIYSGRGGTESYTVGQIKELLSRGIDTKIVTYGHGKKDGRQFHPDIPFQDIGSIDELSSFDATLVFINIPYAIPTKRPAFVMYHFPPLEQHGRRRDFIRASRGKTIMVNSKFLRGLCADFLHSNADTISIVYPFADPVFARTKRNRPPKDGLARVLFAGRLHPEKGIYTFMEMMHHDIMKQGYRFTTTTAGNETLEGQIVETLLRAHPLVTLCSAQHEPKGMAKLFTDYDIVAMPSNHHYWHEGFGMVSVEAQHAGCRVVASNDGGLPETDCGHLTLFTPGDSLALGKTIRAAAASGPVSAQQRAVAANCFTRAASVDSLLAVLGPQAYA